MIHHYGAVLLVFGHFLAQVQCGAHRAEKENGRRRAYADERCPDGRNEASVSRSGDSSTVVVSTDISPSTIIDSADYRKTRGRGPGGGRRRSRPVVVTFLAKVTVDLDDGDGEDAPTTTTTTTCAPPLPPDVTGPLTRAMAELPSGAVMPYLKFKTVSPYLPESQKSDVRVLVDGRNVSHHQFRDELRRSGCGRLADDDAPEPDGGGRANYVTLADGTRLTPEDYGTVVGAIANGSETLTVPNAMRGDYSAYRTLLVDRLPELASSAFVVTPAGLIVPFPLYRAVESEHFPAAAGSRDGNRLGLDRVRWRDNSTADVQTVRDVIDALIQRPRDIDYVFPDRTRVPFVPDGRQEPADAYDCDPARVLVDIGQRENVPLSLFNDIASVVQIPDDYGCPDAGGRFKSGRQRDRRGS